MSLISDLRRILESGAVMRGADYHAQGQVISISADPDGAYLVGRVAGSRRLEYAQNVELEWAVSGRLIEVDGACSCPVGWNCKHVVAVILAAEGALKARSSTPSAKPASDDIPFEVTDWLSGIDQPAPTSPPADCIVYVIDRNRGRPTVQPFKSRLLKSGALSSKATPYSPDSARPHAPAKFLTQADLQILTTLAQNRVYSYGSGHLLPEGSLGDWLFAEIIGTGRARLGAMDGIALIHAPDRPARFDWASGPSGVQVMAAIDAEGRQMMPLGLTPPWFIDTHTGNTGRILTDLPPERASHLAAAPALAPETAALIAPRMAGTADIPLPQVPDRIERRDVIPRPCLTLHSVAMPVNAPRRSWQRPEMRDAPALDLVFDYDGMIVSDEDGPDTLHQSDAARIEVIHRDRAKEAEFRDALAAEAYGYGFEPVEDLPPHDRYHLAASTTHLLPDDPEAATRAIAFSAEALPALRAAGWEVTETEDWPYRVARSPAKITGAVTPNGTDWFALAFSVTVGDTTAPMAPILTQIVTELSADLLADPDLAAALADTTFYPALPDGTRFALPGAGIAPLLKTFQALTGLTGALHAAEADSAWDLAEALEGTDITLIGAEALRSLAARMAPLRDPAAIPPPPGLTATPRPYQSQGIGWLTALGQAGFGGVLADDMGLGKTLQALGLLLTRDRTRPSLVILPTSLMPTWQREAARFAPDLRVLTLHGPDRAQHFDAIARHDLVLTTYPLLHRDHDHLSTIQWDVVIADEGQTLKNPASGLARHVRRLTAQMRVVLSGTPLENNLQELWAIFDWVNPGLLGNRSQFREQFGMPIERDGDAMANARLKARLRPFLLRRTKEAVAADLPPKTEITERISLGSTQQGLYETVRIAMDTRVRNTLEAKGLAASRITVLDALLKLRQVACDPALVKSAPEGVESAKRARLMEMLDTQIAEGRRVLVFSQFVKMLRLIEADVEARGWHYQMLTGETRDRGELVDKFQAGEADLFLISLKAGGTGLTLTAADTVILYDPWWNPAVERQAMDRTHRIGQTRPVFVYRLIAEGTVEEAIRDMQAKKQGLADALFGEGATGGMDLNEADLLALFAKR